ncbi:MAG: S8 family serine peptidase [Cyclobacteriaceae bacterium]
MRFFVLRYGLYLLLTAYVVDYACQAQENFRKDILYIKLDENLASSRVADNQRFQFSNFPELVDYAPLKNKASNARSGRSVLDGIYKVTISEGTDVLALCDSLSGYTNVIYAEPLPLHTLQYVPNDPSASDSRQAYLEVIKAFEAWDVTRGSSNITIGIIDSGLDFDHEDIIPQVWINENDPPNGIDDDANGYVDDYRGYDFSQKDTSALTMRSFHGNRVGGIASAATDNGIGMSGIGFNSKIAALKAYNESTGLIDAGYEAILYAADMGIDIVNLSYGSASFFSQFGQDIIDYAVLEKNVVVVAAAGNSNVNERFYPAAFDHVLSVGATNLDDTKASFSTFNETIDISAPGSNVYSTFKQNGYATDNGTSYSAPMVAGAAALVKSVFPEFSAVQIMEQLRVNSDPINEVNPSYQNLLGYGRLNIQKAVTNTQSKSVRVLDLTRILNEIDDTINPGDTLAYSFKLVNYLKPTDSLTLRISSNSQFVSFTNPSQEIGRLETLADYEVILGGIKVASNVPEKTKIDFTISLQDGEYEDYHIFTFTTNEDKKDIDNGRLTITVDGEGQLGSPYDTPSQGFGLRWKNDTRAYRMGIFVKDSSGKISDNLPNSVSDFTADLDFVNEFPMVWKNYSTPEFHASAIYSDELSDDPIGLTIEQNNITNTNKDYLIQDYRLANNSNTALENLSMGLYIDWELSHDSTDRAYFDSDNEVLISLRSDSTIYSGIAAITNLPSSNYTFDLADHNGNTSDVVGSLSDQDIVTLLNGTHDNAGLSGNGNDIATILTVDSMDIGPIASERLGFVIAFGSTLPQLLAAIEEGKTAYQTFLENPEFQESVKICPEESTTLDPNGESSYNFYSDVLGQNLLGSGKTLPLPAMNADSNFYLAKIDSSVEESLKRIEVLIEASNAQFEMSTDTLYLEEEINSVTFTDMSPNAVSWNWDFGNGNQTTLQHPTLNYHTTGSYTIQLTATTTQGCVSSVSQNLLVVRRPEVPTLLDQNICPNDSIRLFAINADTISLYNSSEAITPIATNRSIWLRDITSDTLFYVASRLSGIESFRVPLRVNLDVPDITYEIVPDVDAETLSAWLINTTDNISNQKWYLGNQLAGVQDTLSVAITGNSIDFSLVVSNTTGCMDSISRSVNFSISNTPSVSFNPPCKGAPFVLAPSDGNYFGFYADMALSQLITKGQSLEMTLSQDTTIYLVGLDSILPSAALEVNITTLDAQVTIDASPDTLYLDEENFVNFTTSAMLSSYQWFLDSELIETVASPTIYLNEEAIHEVRVSGVNPEGCEIEEIIKYVVLPTRIENSALGTSEKSISIYPNPSTGLVYINKSPQERITITDLMGKVVFIIESNLSETTIDLSSLADGIYFIQSDMALNAQRLIIKK